MPDIKRPGTETLSVANCPCCGGDVQAGDCGYSSFNPGWARCNGECGREWKLGYVDSEWDAGEVWNEKAAKIKRRLQAFSPIKVSSALSVSRDFSREDLEKEAERLLAKLKAMI